MELLPNQARDDRETLLTEKPTVMQLFESRDRAPPRRCGFGLAPDPSEAPIPHNRDKRPAATGLGVNTSERCQHVLTVR